MSGWSDDLDLPSASQRLEVFHLLDAIFTHAAQLKAMQTLEKAMGALPPVLLLGPSGSGKSHFCEHVLKKRFFDKLFDAGTPFAEFGLGGIPEGLFEAEVFGNSDKKTSVLRKGRMAEAHGGVLFIDEVGTATPSVQNKLLVPLQKRLFRGVGADKDQRLNAWIVSAHTSEAGIELPLLYRLKGIEIRLLAFAARSTERKFEIFQEVLQDCAAEVALAGPPRFPEDPVRAWLAEPYPWSGGVRELHAIVRTALYLTIQQPELSVAALSRARSLFTSRGSAEASPEATSPVTPPHVDRLTRDLQQALSNARKLVQQSSLAARNDLAALGLDDALKFLVVECRGRALFGDRRPPPSGRARALGLPAEDFPEDWVTRWPDEIQVKRSALVRIGALRATYLRFLVQTALGQPTEDLVSTLTRIETQGAPP